MGVNCSRHPRCALSSSALAFSPSHLSEVWPALPAEVELDLPEMPLFEEEDEAINEDVNDDDDD